MRSEFGYWILHGRPAMGNKASGTFAVETEDLLRRLSFLRHYWKEVGETLRISNYILEELEEIDCRFSPKKKLECVITKWVEENQCRILLPQLREALLDADFVQRDNRIQQQVLNNLIRDQSGEGDYHQPIPWGDNKTRWFWCSRCCYSTLSYLRCSLKYLLPAVIIGMLLLVWLHNVKMDPFDKFLEENEKYVKQLLSRDKDIRILVTGKTGTGKSALINGIMGLNLTKEGDSLDPMTATVAEFIRVIQGIPMIVYDSPGLQDGTKKEKEYLKDMEQKCTKVDLVFYTLKMSETRLNVGDTQAMEKLTNAFGEKFWESVMFVLTFANEVRDPEDPDDDTKNMMHFEKKLEQWKKKLPEVVKQKLNVSENVSERIPVVPAGYYKQPHLPGQGRRYWFGEFWMKALDRMNETSTDGYRLSLSFHKDRFKRAYEVDPEDFDEDIHEQPFVRSTKKSSWFWPLSYIF